MTEIRFKQCFISAPFGTDTSVLRSVLDERGIRWSDQTIVQPGSNWLTAMDDALTKSDFVCVMLPQGQQQGNVLFELGVAYARRKPILAFVASSATLPSDILSLTYVSIDPNDRAAVKLALETFLKHAVERPVRATLGARSKGGPRFHAVSPEPPRATPEFEQRTAKLLVGAGFIVSWPAEQRVKGADFAVWIDEVQHSLGNPLLVDVRAGTLSPQRIREAAAELRTYVSKTHGFSGLLVYWDKRNKEFPALTGEWPLIFQISGAKLTEFVREGRLPEELVRLRNAAVHGEV